MFPGDGVEVRFMPDKPKRSTHVAPFEGAAPVIWSPVDLTLAVPVNVHGSFVLTMTKSNRSPEIVPLIVPNFPVDGSRKLPETLFPVCLNRNIKILSGL